MESKPIHTLRYWVQKVLPLVYDDSLSYYELLSKVVSKLNDVITNTNNVIVVVEEQAEKLEALIVEVEDLMSGRLDRLISEAITDAIKMVFFGLNDDGYFVAYIPDSWDGIVFNTTGLDISISGVDYGHLTLSY